MLGSAKEKAYLNGFYKANTMKDKAIVVDKHVRENLTWLPILTSRIKIGTS